jgi:Ca2+-transporting ATPase
MTGGQFRKMMADEDEENKKIKVNRLRVLARSSPLDKQVLVKFLQQLGNVVAATGDGTNDAPALKSADVGIAMFLSGTAVCKRAADLWLLDDNFASIVAAVVWGRCVFDNIRKFLSFQLTVNIVALVLSLVGAITDSPLPLTTVQLLWINLIMDTGAAVALSTEQPRSEELLARHPMHPECSLINKAMWFKITGQACYQLAVLVYFLFSRHSAVNPGDSEAPADRGSLSHNTFLFNTFVWLQLVNSFNVRHVNPILDGLFVNPYFLGITGASMAIQIMMVELFGSFANTTGQSYEQWLLTMAFAVGSIPWGIALDGLWCLALKLKPDFQDEDALMVIDSQAFEGTQPLDHQYNFKRPKEPHVRMCETSPLLEHEEKL